MLWVRVKELGYWSKGLGFSTTIRKGTRGVLTTWSMKILGQVYWPGGPWSVPRGWAVPTSANPLRIGVPAKTIFYEFVNVKYEQPGGVPIVGGFSIDVFRATVEHLPYNSPY